MWWAIRYPLRGGPMTEERAYTIQFDRELVLEFFLEFSRFEYALKRAGFLKQGTDDAIPDWDGFAQSLRERLGKKQDSQLGRARSVLMMKPPKKQVKGPSGGLAWRDNTPGDGEHEEAFLLRLVRTVRNNLFHGGKYPYPDGPVDDPARDRELLRAAIDVLRACRRLSPRVDSLFKEAA
jgi:hypothetical protein